MQIKQLNEKLEKFVEAFTTQDVVDFVKNNVPVELELVSQGQSEKWEMSLIVFKNRLGDILVEVGAREDEEGYYILLEVHYTINGYKTKYGINGTYNNVFTKSRNTIEETNFKELLLEQINKALTLQKQAADNAQAGDKTALFDDLSEYNVEKIELIKEGSFGSLYKVWVGHFKKIKAGLIKDGKASFISTGKLLQIIKEL